LLSAYAAPSLEKVVPEYTGIETPNVNSNELIVCIHYHFENIRKVLLVVKEH
jgi:hypothetical protein